MFPLVVSDGIAAPVGLDRRFTNGRASGVNYALIASGILQTSVLNNKSARGIFLSASFSSVL